MTMLVLACLTWVCDKCFRYGCAYDRTVHVQGTEIKAITYSNMQIHGIGGEDDQGNAGTGGSRAIPSKTITISTTDGPSDGTCICCSTGTSTSSAAGHTDNPGRVDLFVIVDI